MTMKLASMTITSNRESIIKDAIESVVDFVDYVLILDLGITDSTVEIARSVAGEKVHVISYTGPNETGAMRNAALDAATELGADWACQLDTDERILLNKCKIRTVLDHCRADILLVDDKEHNYCKERFFRLPLKARWHGDVHEFIDAPDLQVGKLEGPTFYELPKTGELFLAKANAIIKAKTDELESDPNNARNWYYLGDALAGLARNDEAIKAFDKCAETCKRGDEGAWALLRSASLLENRGDWKDALARLATGLLHDSGYSPELCWLASWIYLKKQNYLQAIYFARMSMINGRMNDLDHLQPRSFYSLPLALYEGPFEILLCCYANLGHKKLADYYLRKAQKARALREGGPRKERTRQEPHR